MEAYEMQKQIFDSIQTAIDSSISKINTTNSTIGLVSEDPDGFICNVKINSEIVECSLPEHLHSWIQKDDIVIVQDLYNNSQKRVVTGKTGQINKSPSLVFEDASDMKLKSGVDGMFDKLEDEKVTSGIIE